MFSKNTGHIDTNGYFGITSFLEPHLRDNSKIAVTDWCALPGAEIKFEIPPDV